MKCLQCGKEHNRRKFCSNKCKDRFHNQHNPRGYATIEHREEFDEDEDLVSGTWDEDGWLSDDSGVGTF